MKSNVWFTIPENLDIDSILKGQEKKGNIKGFKSEKALFVIDSILKARCSQRKAMLENNTEFANVSSKLLGAVVNDYRTYIDLLLKEGVITTDNQFIEGEKCIGYRLLKPYSGQGLKKIEIHDHVLRKAIKKQRGIKAAERKTSLWGYSYLTKWFDSGKLDIDICGAHSWIEDDKNKKLAIISSTIDIKTQEDMRNSAIDTAEDFKRLVSRIKDSEFNCCFSGAGKRFYTPFTNLKKGLRDFITYDGKPLVEVDIKNSQPFLTLALLKDSFWRPASENGGRNFNLNVIDKEIYERISKEDKSNLIITLLKTLQTSASKASGFENYIEKVIGGTFYENIQTHFQPLFPDRFSSRADVKKEVLRIFYSDTRMHKLPFYEPCKTFYNQAFFLEF